MRTPALRFLHSSILESGMSWQTFAQRQLQNIRPGMRAEVYLLSNPDRRFEGIVQGISPAVQSQENNVEIKGVPFVKQELNWVRIAQRFPSGSRSRILTLKFSGWVRQR